jgi:hypothetical protein
MTVGRMLEPFFRQLQRDRVLHMVVAPILSIFQVLTLVYIWISADFMWGIIIMILLGVVYNMLAWWLDKAGLLTLWRTQESKTKDAEVTNASINLNCARIAKYMKLPNEELDKIESESMKILGIGVNEHGN